VKTQLSAQYRETVNTRFAWSLRGFVYRTSFETSSDTSDFHFRPTDKTQSTASVYSLEWQGTASLFDGNMLVGGIEGTYTAIQSRTYNNRKGVAGALYIQDEWTPREHLTLALGSRLDYTKIDTSASDGQINPRVGVAWTPIEGTILRGSYGWGFRAPSVAERYATASAGGLLTKPSPDLLAERSTSYELGVKQDLPLPLMVDAAVFLNDYDNLVEPRLDPADGKITFMNITHARITGFEAGVRTSLFNRLLEGAVSYTYMYPRDVDSNAILKYRPRHLFYASGEVHILDGTFAADFRYVSRIEEIDKELGILIRNADQRVDAFVTDMRLSWNFARAGLPLKATAIVNNVFNYSYSEIVGNVAPLRNFTLSLEAEF
jgi:outer membrane receptor protein involved in Fe transport